MSEAEFPAELVNSCTQEIVGMHEAGYTCQEIAIAVLREAMPGYAAMVSALEEARSELVQENGECSWANNTIARIDAALKAAGGSE